MSSSPPAGFVARRAPGARAWIREDLADRPLETFWGPVETLAGARGRGAAGRIRLGTSADGTLVRAFARTARRGGALRRLLPPEGFAASRRVFDELAVTEALRVAGVPVARPVAALARRLGALGLWQLRFVTEELDGVLPLPAFVSAHPERRREAVAATGGLIRAAFDRGLVHPDLHPDNVVARLDGDRVRCWLLDLDRARLETPPLPTAETDAMLLRMVRYMYRHAERLEVSLSGTDVSRFLRELGFETAARRAEVTRLEPAFARALARHRLTWRRPGPTPQA